MVASVVRSGVGVAVFSPSRRNTERAKRRRARVEAAINQALADGVQIEDTEEMLRRMKPALEESAP